MNEPLTVAEAAVRAGVTETVVRYALSVGDLEPLTRRTGRLGYRLEPAAVDAWIESRRQAVPRASEPILCVCGKVTPHEPVTNGRTYRTGDIPWGFCSRNCFESSLERFVATFTRLRPEMEAFS